ncbi:MAG: S10 family peptidase [Caulobacteraceae bacterium]
MRPTLLALACALFLSAPLAAIAQSADVKKPDAAKEDTARPHAPSPTPPTAEDLHKAEVAAEIASGWASAPVAEREVVTHHLVATASGRVLHYAATAGTLTLRDDHGKPVASMFYVAYTLDGATPADRPVTFFYNGGPGSSSIWLHMGSLSPVRVTTANPVFIRPAPYGFGPNPQTLLDASDLVFLDAIGTGYSRALGDSKPKMFWGVDEDADAFARGVMRWVTKFDRWDSPKFLYGESYGTTRSAALVWQLQNRGMAINGVILQSSILNYGIDQPGFDELYIGYIPTYAAAAWYHHKIPGPPATLDALLDQARAFALGPYSEALAKGSSITPAESQQIAEQLSRLIGVSPAFIEDSNLRVEPAMFRKELLRDQRLTLGRYDSRYTGVDESAAGAVPDYDASDKAISDAFVAAFQNYLSTELDYHTDMEYRTTVYGMDGFKWDWKHKAPMQAPGSYQREEQMPDVALDLGAAMRTNPYLKVLSLNGYYDMATPFLITEYDLSHMMVGPTEAKNVEFRYYPSGHMIYLNPKALDQLHSDLDAFYAETVESARDGGGEPTDAR